MYNTQSISDRLRDIRTYHGYTQQEIADYLSIKRRAYNEYEIFRVIIPLHHLNSLSSFCNVSIDYLLGLTNSTKALFNFNIELDKKIVSKRLIQIRKELKLTIRGFASKLGISHTTIVDYENGKRLISTSVSYSIAKQYNISVDYLLGKSDKKYIF